MSLEVFVFLISLLSTMSSVDAQILERRVQQCGMNLVKTLSESCGGFYAQKRSEGHFDHWSERLRPEEQRRVHQDKPHPLMSRQEARMFNRIRRNSGLLVEECCRKSCSMNELNKYCELKRN